MADGEPPGRRKVVAAIDTTFRGIDICANADLWLPCLVLVYALIDAMAWLARDPAHEDVTRSDFVDWAETYVLQPPTDACVGLDLYGARCGLLHSHTVESKLMRDGEARPLWYALPNGDVLVPFSSSSLKAATQVGLKDLVDSVRDGCRRFIAAADADPTLGETVWTRAKSYYTPAMPWPSKRPIV